MKGKLYYRQNEIYLLFYTFSAQSVLNDRTVWKLYLLTYSFTWCMFIFRKCCVVSLKFGVRVCSRSQLNLILACVIPKQT
jgi:hypothetical protein